MMRGSAAARQLARGAVWAACVLAACAGPGGAARAGDDPRQSPIVTTERGARGGYLVFVDHDGARAADLTRSAGAELVLDRSPAYSPDGRWIAFASTRGRDSLAETSLWLMAAEPGAEPRRLTSGPQIDRDPTWAPDGRALVYSSSGRGGFDLYRLEIAPADDGSLGPAAEPELLDDSPEHALSPSVSPDGDRVVYMGLDEATQVMSLWILDLESRERIQLSPGPRDMTPAWSPRGDAIAFAAPAEGRTDADLFAVDPAGGERWVVADEPLADQTGPAFSADGRHLLATSVYRSVADGAPILSSVVVVDLDDPEKVMRALHDPVAVESRVGVTLGPSPLGAAEVRANPPYADALRDAVAQELRREQRAREAEAREETERQP